MIVAAMKASAYGWMLLFSAILAIVFWQRVVPYLFHCRDPALFDSDFMPPSMHPPSIDTYFFPQSSAMRWGYGFLFLEALFLCLRSPFGFQFPESYESDHMPNMK
jgi:hypothetical protein